MSAVPTRVVIFAKAPVPGAVKTRLIPALGADGAADLARQMLGETLASAAAAGNLRVELCASPHPDDPAWIDVLPPGLERSDQGQGDLGERLAAASARAIRDGERVLLIGTDCPGLDAARLRAAASHLDRHDVVLYPAQDGGYVLLGLARWHESLFRDIAWSSDSVAAETEERVRALGWSLHRSEPLRDIDDPADLDFYLSHRRSGRGAPVM